MNNIIKIKVFNLPTGSGELGAQKIPLFKIGDINKNTNYGGIDAIRANQAANATSRRISITGRTNVNFTGLQSWSSIQAELRARFQKQGWILHNFSIVLSGAIYGRTAAVQIAADVSNHYTNQEHLDQAYRLFNGFILNAVVTTNHVFSEVDVDINGAEKPGYKAPATQTTSGMPNWNNGGSNNGGNQNYAPPPEAPFSLDKTLADLSKSLFGSAGTTTLIVAGVLVGIIILKR
jgi:hypothetical protein